MLSSASTLTSASASEAGGVAWASGEVALLLAAGSQRSGDGASSQHGHDQSPSRVSPANPHSKLTDAAMALLDDDIVQENHSGNEMGDFAARTAV